MALAATENPPGQNVSHDDSISATREFGTTANAGMMTVPLPSVAENVIGLALEFSTHMPFNSES